MDSTSSYADRLRDINKRINTTNIKGKEYAEVNQRILAFWELFPNGRISTDVKTTEQRCDCRCEVYRDAGDYAPAATGHAFEIKTGTINSTSYVENCETSAIGRALGILGIGATHAIASKEELENAVALQDAKQEKPAPKAAVPPADDYMKPVRDLWPAYERMFPSREEALASVLAATGTEDMRSLTPIEAAKAQVHMKRLIEA